MPARNPLTSARASVIAMFGDTTVKPSVTRTRLRDVAALVQTLDRSLDVDPRRLALREITAQEAARRPALQLARRSPPQKRKGQKWTPAQRRKFTETMKARRDQKAK